jgi:hypothetical protein
MKPLLHASIALLAGVGLAAADEVHLRGGGEIHGVVESQTADKITIDVGAGRVTLPMSRVASVEAGASALTEFRARHAALAPSDVAGRVSLGFWAKDHDLNTQARQMFEEAVALDPGNAPAQMALGRVRLGDRFVSQDDANRAQGLVQYEGQWMTPQEREGRAIAEMQDSERRAQAEARRVAEAQAAEAAEQARAAAAAETGGMPYYPGYGGVFLAYPSLLRFHSQAVRLATPVTVHKPVTPRPVAPSVGVASAATHGASSGVSREH